MSNDPKVMLPHRMPALDGLRGVAILMVVATHCGGGWQAARSITQDTLAWAPTFTLPGWLSAIAGSGVHGVTLFFVVSAFTLTVQAGRRHDGWPAFATRRIARVGPGYWLAGIAYTLVAGLTPRLWAPDGVAPFDLAITALFGGAWQGGAAMAVVPGGWSVSCEVAFYAVLPLLLWAIEGRLWRAIALTAAASVTVQLLARQAMVHGGWHYVPQYINPAVQLPVFLCGITAAVLAQRVRLLRLPGAALALLAVAVAGVPFSPVPEWRLLHHLLCAALAAGAVLLAAQHPPTVLASAAMRRLGEVSFSLYLIHFALLAPCLAAAEWLAPGDGWATLALHMGLTTVVGFALACAAHRWVEQPGVRFGAWLMTRSRPATPAPAE